MYIHLITMEDKAVLKVLPKKITEFGNSAHILLPKKYAHSECFVLIMNTITPTRFLGETKKIEGKTYKLMQFGMGYKAFMPEDKADDFIFYPALDK